MRILKITFENINSIKERHEIDLTLPEFKEDGIFVISGATGSGKTTIFDAAAAAFFGNTSRAKGNSDSECSFMTVGEGFSQAQVEFEAGGRVYRCSWVRRRAGLKADGDFQPAKRELVDVETGQILASNTTDIKTKLEELAKINFERFTRGVILAQGKFDAFLA